MKSRISFALATDAGPVVVEVPAELLAGATVISRFSMLVDDQQIVSLPMFNHGTALHTICSLIPDETRLVEY